ncbi:hypothetical protein H5410_054178 [Solanum commersonii]|uniref:Uncharacterized protein n=1 Tax=Solanum commersonii TaxID=4109 RepID=A0A9J5X739_SOLCO|nr:hypothetical protein H5410_054178 [Solanum commersonii]
MRTKCKLTIVVREMTLEEEAEIAKLRVNNFKKLTKLCKRRLVPHKFIRNFTKGVRNRFSTEINLNKVFLSLLVPAELGNLPRSPSSEGSSLRRRQPPSLSYT